MSSTRPINRVPEMPNAFLLDNVSDFNPDKFVASRPGLRILADEPMGIIGMPNDGRHRHGHCFVTAILQILQTHFLAAQYITHDLYAIHGFTVNPNTILEDRGIFYYIINYLKTKCQIKTTEHNFADTLRAIIEMFPSLAVMFKTKYTRVSKTVLGDNKVNILEGPYVELGSGTISADLIGSYETKANAKNKIIAASDIIVLRNAKQGGLFPLRLRVGDETYSRFGAFEYYPDINHGTHRNPDYEARWNGWAWHAAALVKRGREIIFADDGQCYTCKIDYIANDRYASMLFYRRDEILDGQNNKILPLAELERTTKK